jgi:hypothetical protein
MSTDKDRKEAGKEPQMGQDAKDLNDPAKQQQQSGTGQQYGEGSYSGTRQYNQGMKEHVQHHDIEKEARDAAPRTAAEEKEMEEAERIGRSKARGDDSDSPDEGKTA